MFTLLVYLVCLPCSQEEAQRLEQQLQDIGADVQQKKHEVERVRNALQAAHRRRTQAEKSIRDLTVGTCIMHVHAAC
jgi:outer membrane murein-binding lipoprotein Lpp